MIPCPRLGVCDGAFAALKGSPAERVARRRRGAGYAWPMRAASSTPSTWSRVLDGLFDLRPAPPRRALYALRAAISLGVPILAGWLAGDIAAGLMASIGGFTGLYGSGRAYRSRARMLALVAMGFALTVWLGFQAGAMPWLAIVVVALLAMIATWLCNALLVGAPGAYLFLLACAAGTSMPAAHLRIAHVALLVLAGGACAWIVQMSAALVEPHGPERRAVQEAGRAVIAYLDALGAPHEERARHDAAYALHEAWAVLVSQQPAHARVDARVGRLRAINRALHLHFAAALASRRRDDARVAEAHAEVRRLLDRLDDPAIHPVEARDQLPIGQPGPWTLLVDALRRGSPLRRVVARVGLAALAVGLLGATIHLQRAYWAVAAAVLVLHQGFDWIRTVQRSLQRTVGTWIGLLLAGAILVAHPQGPWLVLVVMALQYVLQLLVVRNYGLAAIFITAVAMTIASGGRAIEHPVAYLLPRGIDTLAGCAMALLVYRLLPPRAASKDLPEQIARCLRAVDALVDVIASGDVTTRPARAARRAVQQASFALTQAYDLALASSSGERRAAEDAWPAIAATERLAYRVLGMCWEMEHRPMHTAPPPLTPEDARHLHHVLADLTGAVHGRARPAPAQAVPSLLAEEVHALEACLA